MSSATSLTRILAGERPFCIIRREERPTVLVLQGTVTHKASLAEIPTTPTSRQPGAIASLSLIPYSQAREKGFEARQGDERLLCLVPDVALEVTYEELEAALPQDTIRLDGDPELLPSEAEYARIVDAVVKNEIGNGEGANFNIARAVKGRIADFTLSKALAIYRNLLQSDYGTYWKFIFSAGPGAPVFVGSTPEKHLSIDKGRVVMNPISGTFRKDKERLQAKPSDVKKALLAFLDDQKEINELFMVVDEELKMMARICDKGGVIAGPFLKEMSGLIHSEYHLIGQTSRGLIENLRDSLFAATVVGSPLENAFRIIKKYEPEPRRYYAAAIAVVGLDEDGEPFLDSPILIRTTEIAADGRFTLRLGATVVHDSVPESEVAETRAKGSAVLGSLTGPKPVTPRVLDLFARDPALLDALVSRNQKLSTFWLNRQEPELAERALAGLRVSLIDHEDDFLYMFGHMLQFLGADVTRRRWDEYDVTADAADLTVLGPGPGNPNDEGVAKMAAGMRNLRALLARGRPLFGVCLGHQLLCRHLGFTVRGRPAATQGMQRTISLFGKPERCGFYNTFYGYTTAGNTGGGPGDPRVISHDPETGEIYALHDPAARLFGFQFHPESILSQNGLDLTRKAIGLLLGR